MRGFFKIKINSKDRGRGRVKGGGGERKPITC